MFWLICALLVLVVALAITAPLWRMRDREAPSVAQFDLQVYRDQLREVERDLERGVIGTEEAERLRTEIGRKVLEADRRQNAARPLRKGGGVIGAGAVLALLLAGAIGLYLTEGAPEIQDLPLSERIAAASATYANRPSQAEAEADAPERPAPEIDQEYADLIQKLRETVATKPNDPQGLTLLATNEMRIGNAIAAREAQQKLVDLRGDKASAEELLRLSAMMTEAAGGLITPEAEEFLARALQMDPSLPQGRYLLGLLQIQNARPDRAFPIWRDLLEEGPYDAPWNAPIRANIRDLAWLAGQPDYAPPPDDAGMPALPGPDADAVTAAEDMSPEERQEMIQGMVSGLESRLATQGGTPEEWARLIGALAVLGETDRARAIWDEAKGRFGATPEAIAPIRAAAEQAGLTE